MRAATPARAAPGPAVRRGAASGALRMRLARLGVEQPSDILFLLPLRYEDRTHVQPIGALQEGMHAVIEGEVLLAEIVVRRRRMLLVRLADGSGSLTLCLLYTSRCV